jgi:hypothetical protein
MGKHLVKSATRVVGLIAAIVGAAATAQATTHDLQYTPWSHLIHPGSDAQAASGSVSEYTCVGEGGLGSLKMVFNQGCGAVAGTWTPWRRAYIDLPYAPNPGTTETIQWSGQQPTNTSIAARPVSFNADGTLYLTSSFVYGAGWQSQYVGNAFGPVVLDVAMRTKAGAITPQLDVVTSEVYAN